MSLVGSLVGERKIYANPIITCWQILLGWFYLLKFLVVVK
jgi:hypothetical protein